MATMIQTNTVDEAWLQLFEILSKQAEDGMVDTSRDGNVVGEITDAVICIKDPTRNIVSNKIRKMPMRYAIGELAWYLSGSNKTADIAQFSKKWEELSDDGIHANSAYGYRIAAKFGFQQWNYVMHLLRKDPNSRQAVIHIKDASCVPTKDTPCTVYLQFLLRNNKLNMSVHMRSNDIWTGVPYDMFSFCFLQILMAMELGVEVGEYNHYAGSLHMYQRDFETAKKNIEKLNKA